MNTEREVGGYALGRVLGHGGMGVVYEARKAGVGPPVALKLMHCGGAAQFVDVARFAREADVLLRIRHPNVVAVHERGNSPLGPFLVSDLVEGVDLKVKLREGPLPALEAARIVSALADGVQTLHDHHVLHRDLKPENVVLRPDGAPILLDLGIARDLKAESLTATGEFLGSPAYMSPEQADGAKRDLGPHTDVYGLGAILFSLLCGRYPHAGGSLASTLKAILQDAPEWPSSTHPEVPAALEAICKRAMAKEHAARYPTAAAMRADLERFLQGDPTQDAARSTSSLAKLGVGLALLAAIVGGIVVGQVRDDVAPDGDRPPTAASPTAHTPKSEARYRWRKIADLEPEQGPGFLNVQNAMVYDPTRRAVVLYGGTASDETPRSEAALKTLWAWRDGRWTSAGVPRADGVELGVRFGHTLAFDERRRRLVLYSGVVPNPRGGAALYANTWESDGVDWTRTAKCIPGGLCFHGMVWDAARERLVMTSAAKLPWGGTRLALANETYTWDGAAWSEIPLPEGRRPKARSRYALGYDRKRKQVVLLGGCSGDKGSFRYDRSGGTKHHADLWFLRSGAATWETFPIEGDRPGTEEGFINGASFVYDTRREELILHGGEVEDRERFSATYRVAGERFTRIATDQAAPSGGYNAFAWDPVRGVAVLHGRDGTWELGPDSAGE